MLSMLNSSGAKLLSTDNIFKCCANFNKESVGASFAIIIYFSFICVCVSNNNESIRLPVNNPLLVSFLSSIKTDGPNS